MLDAAWEWVKLHVWSGRTVVDLVFIGIVSYVIAKFMYGPRVESQTQAIVHHKDTIETVLLQKKLLEDSQGEKEQRQELSRITVQLREVQENLASELAREKSRGSQERDASRSQLDVLIREKRILEVWVLAALVFQLGRRQAALMSTTMLAAGYASQARGVFTPGISDKVFTEAFDTLAGLRSRSRWR